MKRLIRLFLWFMLLFLLGCGEKTIESNWIEKEISIDGKFNDWEGAPFLALEDNQYAVSAQNDSSSFVMLFQTKDMTLRQLIRRTGFMLWIDPGDEKKKEFGIRYVGTGFGSEPVPVDESLFGIMNPEEREKAREMWQGLRGSFVLVQKGELPVLIRSSSKIKWQLCSETTAQHSVSNYEFLLLNFRYPI